MRSLLIIFFALPLLFFLVTPTTHADDTSRSITIMNESGRRAAIYWINPDDGELLLQSDPDILYGASFDLDSYVGHNFEVRELPKKSTNECSAGEAKACGVDYFTVTENHDQVIYIMEGMRVEHIDTHTLALKTAETMLDECKFKTKSLHYLSDVNQVSTTLSTDSILDALIECIKVGLTNEIISANEEIAFQSEVRTDMGEQMENYTCADRTLNTTEPKRTEYWEGRTVSVMIDRPAAKIHVIDDFATLEECMAVEEMARPGLHKAAVADNKGGSEISDNRKAMQAGIKVHWDKEGDGDLIARLSRRVYDYVNHVLPFDIRENGQEDLMSIQYFGRGTDDDKPDRYMPHCDGDCNGLDFKTGQRMATIVMYCNTPEVGGQTRFRNSNVHIIPKKYAATFFSYIDPKTMKMDSGLTEHSGCPVIEGEKKIVTQWIRLGVSDADPWDSWNTLGVKYSDAENQ